LTQRCAILEVPPFEIFKFLLSFLCSSYQRTAYLEISAGNHSSRQTIQYL